jgi:regulator of sirC expression with transglutaminase-like and TPR domain
LLYAREIAYPDLRPSAYLARLDDWAGAVRQRADPDGPPDALSDEIVRFLFGELGLRGNAEDYGDPRNSYLNEVMTRGLGLPITLSVLFLEVAARLGLPAEGVGLPGHFLVAVRLPGFRLLLDPFNGGASVSAEDAARLVHGSTGYAGPLQREWFEPSPPRLILARMLFNLRGVYVQRESWAEARAVVERLMLLQPDEAEHQRDLGLLYANSGGLRLAANHLGEYLRRRPDAQDAALIRQSLSGLLDQLARLN